LFLCVNDRDELRTLESNKKILATRSGINARGILPAQRDTVNQSLLPGLNYGDFIIVPIKNIDPA
jgi:hypothetical protein